MEEKNVNSTFPLKNYMFLLLNQLMTESSWDTVSKWQQQTIRAIQE